MTSPMAEALAEPRNPVERLNKYLRPQDQNTLLAKALRGELNAGEALQGAAIATTPVPIVGDLVGAAADAHMYATDPESRTWGNAAMSAAGLLPFVPSMAAAIKAYHGSPHTFDKFSMDKIGTGEGAQAYGHGLYFTDTEEIATEYRDTLKWKGTDWDNPEYVAGFYLDQHQGDRDKAIRYLDRRQNVASIDTANKEVAAKAAQILRDGGGKTTANPGALYTVRLDVEPDDLLDWDKPLSEQPEKVRKAVTSRLDQLRKIAPDYIPQDPSGQWLAKAMGPQGGIDKWDGSSSLAQAASEALRAAGIKGIRYLDGNSRGAGEGTYNYVMFDDKLIDIESRK